MTPEDLRALYRSASTPHDAAMVIRERGRPSLAVLVQSFTRTPLALVSAQLFAGWSKLVAAGGCRGWGVDCCPPPVKKPKKRRAKKKA